MAGDKTLRSDGSPSSASKLIPCKAGMTTVAAFLSSRAEKLASVQMPTKMYILELPNKGGSDEERKSLARRFDSSVGE